MEMTEEQIAEIERKIPTRTTECSYCHRLGTLWCPRCAVLACDEHRAIHARESARTGCNDVEMIPARHDDVTMHRVALVTEVRRLRAALTEVCAEAERVRKDLAHALLVVQGWRDGAAMPEARDAAQAMLDAIRARGAGGGA